MKRADQEQGEEDLSELERGRRKQEPTTPFEHMAPKKQHPSCGPKKLTTLVEEPG